MASDGDIRIDLRGDGRVILYKRDNLKDPVWQVRVRVPNSTGYKRITTKTSDQREAERFALNYYEELYIHVKTGGSIKSKTFKQVFANGKNTSLRWDTLARVDLGKQPLNVFGSMPSPSSVRCE